MVVDFTKVYQFVTRGRLIAAAIAVLVAGGGAAVVLRSSDPPRSSSEMSSQSRKGLQQYMPTDAEWASLTIEPVQDHTFRAEHVTEGRLCLDDGDCHALGEADAPL